MELKRRMDDFTEIEDSVFKELPEALFESVLLRTINYEFYEHVLDHEFKKIRIGVDFDYKQSMREFMAMLMAENWFIVSRGAASNGIPVHIFQKDAVTVLAAGSRAGNAHGVATLLTSSSRKDLDLEKRMLKL